MQYVLDASLILAKFNGERGGERLADFVGDAAISVVTYVEVVTKLMDGGAPFDAAHSSLSTLMLRLIDVDASLARRAAELRGETRVDGLSLGDRLCLATAESLGATAVTADQAWRKAGIGIPIEFVH
jgi:PIN domain nuclease of toxin-antitoxin system